MADVDDVLLEADHLVAEGNWSEAGSVISSGLATHPDDPRLEERSLRIAARLDGPEAALARLGARRAERPVVGLLAVLEVELLLAAGRYVAGIDAARAGYEAEPDDADLAALLLDGLELAGRVDEAFELARALAARPATRDLGDQRALELEATARAYPAWMHAPVEVSRMRESCSGESGGEADLERAFSVFGGNREVHARQTRFRSGEWGYVPVSGALNEAVLAQHRAGELTAGVYLLDPAAHVQALVLDLDVRRECLTAYLESPTRRADFDRRMRAHLVDVIRKARTAGLDLLPESSGFKGYHLWGFCEPVPAGLARALGEALVAGLDLGAELRFEVFPKQDRLSGRGLGNLVKLPLGVHRRSGLRSRLLDPNTLEEMPDDAGLARLLEWPRCGASDLARIIGVLGGRWRDQPRRLAALPAPEPRPARQCSDGEERGPGASAPPTERVIVPWPEVMPARVSAVMGGCAVVRELVEGVRAGGPVSQATRHIAIQLFAHLGEEGHLFAHQLLCRCADYNPDTLNRDLHAVGRWPIGCRRIRELSERQEAAQCRCSEVLRRSRSGREYASPVHFAALESESVIVPPTGEAVRGLIRDLQRRAGGDATQVVTNLMASRRRLLAEDVDERARRKSVHPRAEQAGTPDRVPADESDDAT